MACDNQLPLRTQDPRTEEEEIVSGTTALALGSVGHRLPSPLQTSNDLLFLLHGLYVPKHLNYDIVAQSTLEVQDIQNAPAISMGAYLESSHQAWLLTTLSIYSQPGTSRDQIRFLYMNSVALLVWQAMGRFPKLVGAQHRPPKGALLAFGVPFSE